MTGQNMVTARVTAWVGTSTVTVTSSPVTISVDASLEHPEVCQSQVPSSPRVRIFGYFKDSLALASLPLWALGGRH